MKDIRVLLDNVRSVHNVGSIFRTAEGAGVYMIYLAGTTPTPLDRFDRKRKDFAKVSLGAEDLMKWQHSTNKLETIKQLKKEGFTIVAVEQAKNSRPLNLISAELKKRRAKKVLFVFGNEVDGVSKHILKATDFIAEIAMKGKKESLNVSVVAGIALYVVQL